MDALSAIFHAELGAPTQALLRSAYGCLLLVFLGTCLPHARRFFLDARHGGYTETGGVARLLAQPAPFAVVYTLWLAAAAGLIAGRAVLPAALLNLVLCRHFFVALRWRGVLRGLGAPGFMCYWLGAAVCLLEYSAGPDPRLRPLVVTVLVADLAFIILSAGLYKLRAGYRGNEGMEYGLVNPAWGYCWRPLRHIRPRHPIFRLANQAAWAVQIATALLLVVPQTRWLGALLLMATFAALIPLVRIGVLCELMVVCALLGFAPDSPPAGWIAALVPAPGDPGPPAPWAIGGLHHLLAALQWAYLLQVPLAHGGLWLNLYGRRRLPGLLQRALETYTNFFGLIVWRVFSVDLVDFFVRIHHQGAGERVPVSRYGPNPLGRFGHVGESIALAGIFTALKYHPQDESIFRRRLLCHARTLPLPPGQRLVYEYLRIIKDQRRFAFVPAVEFLVDPRAGTIEERRLRPDIDLRSAHPCSPVHAGAHPGSYTLPSH